MISSGDKGMLLTHIQFGIQQDLQILLHRAAFQLDSPQQPSSCTAGGFSFSDADFALPLVGFHEVPVSPFSVKIPVESWNSWNPLEFLCCISHSSQFGVIREVSAQSLDHS